MLRISYRTGLIAVAVLALLPTAIALVFFDGPAQLAGLPFSSKILALAGMAACFSIIPITLKAAREKRPSPIGFLIETIKSRPSSVLVPAGLIILSSYPSSTFSFLKNSIPKFVPFYADPFFVSADRWLFLGTDPWRISHAIIGPSGTIFLDKVYIAWFAVIPLLAVWICASNDRTFQLRGILTIFFMWIVLGNFAAMALSSCGPVFYEEFYQSDYYKPLMAELNRVDRISSLSMIQISEWLLEMRRSGGFGTGISAMPSLHVAIAYFAFLVVWDRYRTTWAVSTSGIFALLIWIGSFHLAWHYAWDGIVSVVAVWAFWRLLGFVEIVSPEAQENALSASEQT